MFENVCVLKKVFWLIICLLGFVQTCFCWGFYAHRQINYYAVFLLPPELIAFYKKHISFLADHAVDPDKRRYAIAEEGPRHYIDIDHYGKYPYDSLPRSWEAAVKKYSEDSITKYGIGPWWINKVQGRLTKAFVEKNIQQILKLSADIGHYIGDAHVPLHASSNHNGQHTNQHGIHGFWESRIPELFAASSFDFIIGRAVYLDKPLEFTWLRVLESAAAADTVLKMEKLISAQVSANQKFAFEDRNGLIVRQYATDFTSRYHQGLNGMVERRMRQSIFAVASFWYTAWVNAGQPDMSLISGPAFSSNDRAEWDSLNMQWQSDKIKGRSCEYSP
jgi:hypothetical protein